MSPRFFTLPDVAETLNISMSQARALVTSGELPAIQVGGRGQWRVEASELEAYIQRMYAQTRARVESKVESKVEARVDARVDAGASGAADPDEGRA